MSACSPLSYPNVSTEAWNRIKGEVVSQMPSLAPMQDAGSGQHDGITIAWTYENATLTLTITDTSWWDPSCDTLNAKIDALVKPLLA